MNTTKVYSPVESDVLEGEGHYLCSAYRNLGGFDARVLTARQRELRLEAEKWVFTVEKTVGGLKAGEIQKTLAWYDLVHRVAFSRPSDFRRVYGWMRRAMTGMARGEEADKAGFMGWVSSSLYFHVKEMEPVLLDWYGAVLDRWTEEFSRRIPKIGKEDVETLSRINFLLRERLGSSVPEEGSYKERLIEAGLPALRYIDIEKRQSGSVSPEMLNALSEFSFRAWLSNPGVDHETIKREILTLLSFHPTLTATARRAYALDLEYEKEGIKV